MAIGGTFSFSTMITVSWPVDTPPSMSDTWYLIVVTPTVVGAVNVITLPRLIAEPRVGAVDDTTVSGLFDPSGSESLMVTSFDPIAPDLDGERVVDRDRAVHWSGAAPGPRR